MTNGSLVLRFASGTDPGRRRRVNEDSVYANPRLLAVADGMGAHPHGEVASAVTLTAIAEMDVCLSQGESGETDPLAALSDACGVAAGRLTELAEKDRDLTGMGTTLTAMLWTDGGFAVAHVGDSRGYLLRDGSLTQFTHDHTMIQSLVDEGHLSPEQAEDNPRRSILIRALQAGGTPEPDLFTQEARDGDRYLLCSDGVTCVVKPEAIQETLSTTPDPEDVVARLIELANEAGGPDNISCVVADVVSGE
jgi:serine/threonine protein phosphatase PrpC